jgi:hypothetical protein
MNPAKRADSALTATRAFAGFPDRKLVSITFLPTVNAPRVSTAR